MALRSKKLQLKKVKKTTPRKKRKATLRREATLSNITHRLATAQALRAPLYECWESEGLFETNAGMGTVVVARKTAAGQILMATFFLDIFCLGAKNAYCLLMGEEEYRLRLGEIETKEILKKIHPSCARKLVEDAVAHAENLDFYPHEDYDFAKKIFGDVEKELCPHSFAFGKEGKRRRHTGLKDPSPEDHSKKEASNFQPHGYFHELKRVSS